MNELTQTGRTTRMVKEAVAEAAAGKCVFVMCATEQAAELLAGLVAGVAKPGTSVRVTSCHKVYVNEGSVSFEAVGQRTDWDWYALRGVRAHPSVIFHVDHYVIERQFAKALTELHRYDAAPVASA